MERASLATERGRTGFSQGRRGVPSFTTRFQDTRRRIGSEIQREGRGAARPSSCT